MPPSTVHRTLRLSSPHAKGPDVEQLQYHGNSILDKNGFDWREIERDGEYGNQTRNALHMAAWLMGLSGKRLRAIKKGRITERVQEIIRDPSKRSTFDFGRAKLRRAKAKKLREAHSTGPNAACEYIEKMARDDVHEIGSTNRSPLVDLWEQFFGILGEPWCGCLAGYAAKAIGGSTATTWFPYGPSIAGDARAGKNGVTEVSFDRIQRGDVLVLWGGEHIVTALGPPTGDSVPTGEGNTSPDPGGDQANGGSVETKTRSRSDVTCCARVY